MKKTNVILISLDGFRADVSYSGKFPTLTELIGRGVTFKNVVSQAPLTPVSHASVLTGLMPPRHGIRHLFLEQLSDGVETIGTILKKDGYQTHAVISCPGLHSWYGHNKGFDTYDDKLPLGPDGKDALFTVDVKARGEATKRAEDVVKKALKLADSISNDPFFFFLHFFDAHWPYSPPLPYKKDYIDNPYEGEIAYIDKMLGDLINNFSNKGLLKNTILVIFSDHGEDLNGLYPNDHGDEHPEEEGHGCLLYDATQLVPLIIVFPDRYKFDNINIEEQVRLVDITPTLLDILKIDSKINFDGKSLMRHINGEGKDLIGYCETHYPMENSDTLKKYPLIRNLKAVRIRSATHEFKVIWQIDGDIVEVYDLLNDPNERKNLLSI